MPNTKANYAHTISEMKRINAENGFFFWEKSTIKFWGSHTHAAANRWGLFIESHDNFDRTAKLYTVRVFLPGGNIETIEPAAIAETYEHFNSIYAAKAFREKLTRAFDDAAKYYRENNVLSDIKSIHEIGLNTGVFEIKNNSGDTIQINTNNFDRFISG